MSLRPVGGTVPFTVQADGTRLAGWRRGDSGPTLVFLHGFPDTSHVWDEVTARLEDRFRCIAYDVRGTGQSAAPAGRAGYRLSCLVDDLARVIESQSPDEAVHVVGHDWGSIQGWEAVVRERSEPLLRGRIASYTTISGPCLHHVDAFIRSVRRGHADRQAALSQLRRSWYAGAFLVPVLPELVMRTSSRRLMRRLDPARRAFAETLPRDAVNGLELYRANTVHRTRVPGGPTTTMPVQLVVPVRDAFITAPLVDNVATFAPDLTRVEMDAGHWVMSSHPEELAGRLAAFVTATTATSG